MFILCCQHPEHEVKEAKKHVVNLFQTQAYNWQIYTTSTIFNIKVKNKSSLSPIDISVKDRQQEASAILVVSHCIGDYYMALWVQYMYYITHFTLLYGRLLI